MKGILGRKVGMTSVFTKDGKLMPVTVVEVKPNVVTQIRLKLQSDNIEKFNAIRAAQMKKLYD